MNGVERKAYFLLVILLAALLQATIVNNFRLFIIKPDLLVIAAVLASLLFRLRWALLFSILAGALKDIFGMSVFNTFFFAAMCVVIMELSRKISMDSDYLCAALVFIIVFINGVIMRISFFYSGITLSTGVFLKAMMLGSLYTSVVSLVVFRFIRPFFSRQFNNT